MRRSSRPTTPRVRSPAPRLSGLRGLGAIDGVDFVGKARPGRTLRAAADERASATTTPTAAMRASSRRCGESTSEEGSASESLRHFEILRTNGARRHRSVEGQRLRCGFRRQADDDHGRDRRRDWRLRRADRRQRYGRRRRLRRRRSAASRPHARHRPRRDRRRRRERTRDPRRQRAGGQPQRRRRADGGLDADRRPFDRPPHRDPQGRPMGPLRRRRGLRQDDRRARARQHRPARRRTPLRLRRSRRRLRHPARTSPGRRAAASFWRRSADEVFAAADFLVLALSLNPRPKGSSTPAGLR